MAVRRRITFLSAIMGSACAVLGTATLMVWASPLAADGGWPPPIQIPQDGDSVSRGPSLVQDSEGALQVIWMEEPQAPMTDNFTVFHAESTDEGDSWSYTVPLTPSGGDRFQADMDLDDFDGLHLVWYEAAGDYQLWYGQLFDGSWEEKVMVTNTQFLTRPINGPDVELTDVWVHAIWSESNPQAGGVSKFDVYYSRSEGGVDWSLPEPAADTKQSSFYARLDSDGNGDLHVVWEENSSPREIMYISGTVGTIDTVWSLPITLSTGLTENSTAPDIAVGSDDQVHVVFGVDVENEEHIQDVYYAGFGIGDTGSISPTLIPGSRVEISQLLPTFASPAVTLFGTDQVHVAWNGLMNADYSDRIYYVVSEDGGLTWSEPAPVSPRDSWPDGFASLVADGEFIYIVWQEKVSGLDQDIYFTRRFPFRITFPIGLQAY